MLPAAWARSQPTRRPGGVAGGGQPLDRVRLAGGEVDAGQEDQRDLAGPVGDGRLEILGPDGGFAGSRSDHDEVPHRVQPALGEVGRQGVAVRREERAVGQDPAAPAVRPEERGEQEMEVHGQAVEQGDLGRGAPTTRAIGSRTA